MAGPTIPVLHPGEQASSHTVTARPDGTLQVVDWLIEPAPGWTMWWRRFWYNLTHRETNR